MSHRFVKELYSQITNDMYGNRLTNLSFKSQLTFEIIKLSDNGENKKKLSIAGVRLVFAVEITWNFHELH